MRVFHFFKNYQNQRATSFFSMILPVLAVFFFSSPIFSFESKPSAGHSGDLIFRLTGLTPNRGWARVVLYDREEKFLSQFGFAAADSTQVGADGVAEITLKNLPFGKYAGSFYQDENHNFIIDRNFAGLPTEPFGFSNGVRAKWRVPDFQSVLFDFQQSGARQSVRLAYWSQQ